MAFKINVSNKGKTFKLETENEVLIGKKIGETIDGSDLSEDLKGYVLEIKGTSDISGIPGKKGLEGNIYHRELLTRGFGMRDTRKGIRLKKTLRGEEIGPKTIQINTIVKKEGSKKFADLTKEVKAAE
jgi:small subunit ribosomal protein S6e